MLPAIRKAVGPDVSFTVGRSQKRSESIVHGPVIDLLQVEVIHDGGVQRGTDIAKALALGADGVKKYSHTSLKILMTGGYDPKQTKSYLHMK